MNRLFVRLWVVALALFVVGLLGEMAITLFVWSDDEVGYWEGIYAPGLLVAADSVVDAADPEPALERVAAHAGTDARLVGRSEVPAEVDAQLLRGRRLGWLLADRGEFYFAPAHDGETVLVVGPMPAYPMPDPVPRLLLIALLAVVLGGGFWLVLRPLHRSQRAIAAATGRIADGALDTRLGPEDTPAAPHLARAFNEMGERIEDLVGQQQRMLRVASHELRTPLARMRLGLHLLDQEVGGGPRTVGLARDLDELEALVEDILLHARLERTGAGRVSDVVVADVVAELVDTAQELAGHTGDGVRVRLVDEVDAVVPASERLLRRAVSNLLSNAVRYAETVVSVSTLRVDGVVVVRVDDDGPGIAVDQRAAAVQPFSTLDERSRHGLGLSIVDGVMGAHGGQLVLLEAPGGGLRAELWWGPPPPASQAPPPEGGGL